jgi:hypothetical protein
MPKKPGETFEGREPLTDESAAEFIVSDAEQILFDRHTKSILEHRTRKFITDAGPIVLEGVVAFSFVMGTLCFPLAYLYKNRHNKQTK